nr:MlaD family protein [Nocardia neocaledoniensis]
MAAASCSSARSDAQSSDYCAALPDAIGLYAGNAVTQMGLKVGTVGRVEPKGSHVEVTFSLDGDRRFPANVQAVTRSKSLLADRSLELVGNYETGTQLQPGQCIPPERSYTPKSISEIAGSASDFIDAMAPVNGQESLERSIVGMADAMRSNGVVAQSMMSHASAAMTGPDQLVADLAASIKNMAPLTDDALRNWVALRSILDQLPEVVAAGRDLWQGPIDVVIGVAYLTPVLLDIQRNYGDDLWPFVHGGVVDAIHLAATRSKDIQSLIATVPMIADLMRQQSGPSGFAVQYKVPTVQIDNPEAPLLCDALNAALVGSCSTENGRVQLPATRLLDLALSKGDR